MSEEIIKEQDDNEELMMSDGVVYTNVYKKRLADELKAAKGRNRTMAEFAQACNVSPTTFSRILNGKLKKPLSDKMIQTIYDNAENQEYTTVESLMRANGKVPKSDDTPRRQMARKRSEDNQRKHEASESIITRELLAREYMISSVYDSPEDEENDPLLKRSRFFFGRNIRFALKMHGRNPLYWHFSTNIFTGEEFAGTDKYMHEVADEAMSLIYRYEDIFLRDVWEPESFENTKYSIVMINKDLFESFSRLLGGLKFNSRFSLILIDLKNDKVVEERDLPRHNGEVSEKLFEKKKRSYRSLDEDNEKYRDRNRYDY